MYVVIVEFELHVDHISEFVPLIRENARMSLEFEQGCCQFDICVDPKVAAYILLYEVYVDRAAFEAHLLTAHFGAFDRASAAMVLGKTAKLLERI